MKILLPVVLLCAFASSASAQRLYIFTAQDPSGIEDDAQRERNKAVTDLAAYLTKQKLAVTQTREDATVVVEVLAAGWEDTGRNSITPSQPIVGTWRTNAETRPERELIARATITEGTYRTAINASVGPFNRTFGENLARKVQGWLNDRAKGKK